MTEDNQKLMYSLIVQTLNEISLVPFLRILQVECNHQKETWAFYEEFFESVIKKEEGES